MSQLLDEIVLPVRCVGCTASGQICCARCRGRFLAAPRPVAPRDAPARFPLTWALGDYAGARRAVLLAYKERGVTALATPIAHGLTAAAARAAAGQPCALVPVPATRESMRRRRGDPLARLAAEVAALSGGQARVVPALQHARAVADSVGLGSRARADNLAGALRAGPAAARLRGRRVVIVDDVVTTGATLAEAVRALEEAGVAAVTAAVVAASRLRALPGGGKPV